MQNGIGIIEKIVRFSFKIPYKMDLLEVKFNKKTAPRFL